ncbi:MAG: hypothetical protein AAGI45_01745 [Cyanobacteria bacterium P01_H01_bin.26]
MPVINYGELFSSLFTWLKLGTSLTVLVLLVTKIIDVWQGNPSSLEEQHPVVEVIQDIRQEIRENF